MLAAVGVALLCCVSRAAGNLIASGTLHECIVGGGSGGSGGGSGSAGCQTYFTVVLTLQTGEVRARVCGHATHKLAHPTQHAW